MDITKYTKNDNEKPLDYIPQNGGMCRIFRRIACVGDSLSSGEFETKNADDTRNYYDMYEYSWGQYIARMCGSKVYNFSKGGMTAKEYMESFADRNGFWNRAKAAQAYIIALGVNDLNSNNVDVGSKDDIDLRDYRNNKPTFAGYYGQIVQRYKEISPDAKFFFVTMPKCNDEEKSKKHRDILENLTEVFDNSYLIDLYSYAPNYDDEYFKKIFFMNSHMSPMGYVYSADIIAAYIDYIIRNNPEDFKMVGFI